MKKIVSFLRWEFKGCTKSPTFWGGLINFLGLIMLLSKCPQPYPSAFIGLGVGLMLGDLVYTWIKFRIAMYNMEQERIATTLKGQ